MAERRPPEPPPARGTPALVELPPGPWFRVHAFDPATGRHGAARFNDSGAGNARFSPLWQGERLVPTLYAARSLRDPGVLERLLGLLDRLGCGVAPDR